MSLGETTPVLSRKQQNKTIANKKKSAKAIRNVLTFKSATHWPLLTDESEKSSLLNILHSMKANLTKNKNYSNNKEIRQFAKFGINEVVKYVEKNDCQVILLDADIPRVLTMHVISTAISKSIPVLCIQELKKILNDCYGFKSSSICFTNAITNNVYSNLPKIASELCNKNFGSIYKTETDTIEHEEISGVKSVTKNSKSNISAIGSLEYIKLDENAIIVHKDDRGRKSKRKCSFEPLLIKRIRMNSDRQINQ